MILMRRDARLASEAKPTCPPALSREHFDRATGSAEGICGS
jgi:hypothetical protein